MKVLMKMIRIGFLLSALLLCGRNAWAQSQISGKVVDAAGLPVIGATAMIEGTTIGTMTDVDGVFTLNAAEGQTVIVMSLGYTDKAIKITSATTYNVILEEDSMMLEETVVVGYDVQKKVNLTGAVSAVDASAIEGRPIVSSSSALQGIAAGVTVTTQSGNPGASGTTIKIRGIGTFGGSSSEPLVLIDGVAGSMDDVDASQIDKISVLKDAASSAIYGSRAANGVILITTKRADKNQVSVTYRGYAGWAQPTDIPQLVDAIDYMKLSREASLNDGTTPVYSEDYIANYMENHRYDPDTYPITKWQEKILNGSGFLMNHSLTINAGNEMIQNSISLGYLDQDGIIKRQDYERYNVRNNMNIKLHEKLTLRFDSAFSFGRRKAVPLAASLFNAMNTRDPLVLTQWSSGDYAPMTGGSVNALPTAEGYGGNKRVDYFKLNASIALTYKPFEWLTIEGSFSPRYNITHTHQFDDVIKYMSDAYGTLSPVTSRLYNKVSEAQTQNFYKTSQATAIFHKNFDNTHDFKLQLGVSRETLDQRYFSASRQSLPYPEYDVLNMGADDETKDNAGTRTAWALQSYFGRVNYNYKERYLFEANIRFDGSSRFAQGNRWGIFPSVSGAWRITEEPFMESVSHIMDQLKLRVSYGSLGNQNIGSSNYPFTESLAIGAYPVGSTINPIITLTTLANPNITWETSTMYDVGIDLMMWNRFSLTADWYHKTTNDILMQLNIPYSTGLNKPYQNAGVVRNIGWELAVGYHDSWGDFSFGADVNLSDVHNEIIEMHDQYETHSGGIIRNQEGSPINSIYGLECIGMARTQDQADWINANLPQFGTNIKAGDLIYGDTNGDGKVNDDDMTIIGCAIPRYTYGVNLNFGWKGLNLGMFLQGVGKADSYLSSSYVQPCINGGTFRTEHLDRWTEATPDGFYPRMSYASEHNRRQSSFWMRDASYLRLKNLQLSYNIPERLLEKMRIKKLMVFANAENLFTLTNFYQGYDPEVGYSAEGSNGVSLGDVANNYPQVKTFTFGVELKF